MNQNVSKRIADLESRLEVAKFDGLDQVIGYAFFFRELGYLLALVKRQREALDLIAGPVEFYDGVGERNKQVVAVAALAFDPDQQESRGGIMIIEPEEKMVRPKMVAEEFNLIPLVDMKTDPTRDDSPFREMFKTKEEAGEK